MNGLGSLFPPVAFYVQDKRDLTAATRYFAFWLKPVSIIWLVVQHDVYQEFTVR